MTARLFKQVMLEKNKMYLKVVHKVVFKAFSSPHILYCHIVTDAKHFAFCECVSVVSVLIIVVGYW